MEKTLRIKAIQKNFKYSKNGKGEVTKGEIGGFHFLIAIFLLVSLSPLVATAQFNEGGFGTYNKSGEIVSSLEYWNLFDQNNGSSYDKRGIYGSINENVKGSTYFNESFLPGKVVVDNNEARNLMLRYNAYSDEMEVRQGKDSLVVLLKNSDIECLLGSEVIACVPFTTTGEDINLGFMTVLHQGEKYKLYVRKTKKLKDGYRPANSLQGSFPDRLVDDIALYGATTDGTARPLGRSRRSVLSFFAENEKGQLKTFIKKNNLKMNKESNLIALFKHAENL